MQTICTSFQTDNHMNTSSLNFYRPDALPDAQPTVSKHWRQRVYSYMEKNERFTRSTVYFTRSLVRTCCLISSGDRSTLYLYWGTSSLARVINVRSLECRRSSKMSVYPSLYGANVDTSLGQSDKCKVHHQLYHVLYRAAEKLSLLIQSVEKNHLTVNILLAINLPDFQNVLNTTTSSKFEYHITKDHS